MEAYRNFGSEQANVLRQAEGEDFPFVKSHAREFALGVTNYLVLTGRGTRKVADLVLPNAEGVRQLSRCFSRVQYLEELKEALDQIMSNRLVEAPGSLMRQVKSSTYRGDRTSDGILRQDVKSLSTEAAVRANAVGFGYAALGAPTSDSDKTRFALEAFDIAGLLDVPDFADRLREKINNPWEITQAARTLNEIKKERIRKSEPDSVVEELRRFFNQKRRSL